VNKTSEKSNKSKWFLLGLVAVVIGAPNSTIIRNACGEIDSLTLVTLKYVVIALVFLPTTIRFCIKHAATVRKNLKTLIPLAILNAVSTTVFFVAIEQGSASYAEIISLLSPIILVLLSARMVRDKVSRRAVGGITLAAIGGLLVVALPTILHGSAGPAFYPLATILILINDICYPLIILYQRRANEGGMPLTVCTGIVGVVGAIAMSAAMLIANGSEQVLTMVSNLSLGGWVAVLYTGIVVTAVARNLAIISFEHVGAAVQGGLSYLETLLAISLPLIILGETLSVEMMIGALLILLGVFLTESGGKHHWHKLGGKVHLHHAHRHGGIK
jgi:drug/metabolite transporter (DMT)-like permease